MPARFPYKLSQYEIQPPSESWEKLDHWLHTEYHRSDTAIQEKLSGSEIAPPPLSWEKISANLPDQAPAAKEKQKPGVVIPGYKRLAVAAAVTAIASIAVFYFFNPYQRKEPASLATIDRVQEPPIDLTTPPQQSTPQPDYPAVRDLGESGQPSAQPAKAVAINGASHHFSHESYASPVTDDRMIAESFIASADLQDIRVVDALQPVAVKAPPIRDESGKIIMDINLVSDPNSPHIVVTSPNGSQTRISNKFVHCLSYLNAYVASETNIEGKIWEARFQEWRNQLLQEAAFIPCADNFFDIFELKEMILESR